MSSTGGIRRIVCLLRKPTSTAESEGVGGRDGDGAWRGTTLAEEFGGVRDDFEVDTRGPDRGCRAKPGWTRARRPVLQSKRTVTWVKLPPTRNPNRMSTLEVSPAESSAGKSKNTRSLTIFSIQIGDRQTGSGKPDCQQRDDASHLSDGHSGFREEHVSRQTLRGCPRGSRFARSKDGYIGRRKEIDFLVGHEPRDGRAEDVMKLDSGARRGIRRAV